MATTALPSGATLATAKKAAAAKAAAAKKPRTKSSHPRTADMVDAAIKALKERGGSSLQAIKKYITATYKIDAEKLSPFIKRYLKSGVVAKKLVQTKGKGASGSFKLSAGDSAAIKAKKSPAAAVKKVVAKKSTVSKKPSAAKKSPAKKKAASPKKKVLKTLAAKPPKPKVSKAKKPTAAKKPAKKIAKKAPAKK